MREDDFYNIRSSLLNAMGKFKEACEKEGRNFKVEVDEVFAEVDEN